MQRERGLRRLLTVLILATLVGSSATAAGAQNRIALVIGNDHYPNLLADQQLAKAVNDANAIGDSLERIGFIVIRGQNLDRQGMVDRIFEFTRKINPGDTALLFYAGHGIAISGGNYLLPSDIKIAGVGEETRVRNMAIGEADIVADIQERKPRVAVLVLDACRDNPFRQRGVKRSVGGDRGLTRGEEAEGIFAIYSAGFGQSALDSLGPDDNSLNSVFTRVLAPALVRPNMHLAELMIDVREEVAKIAATANHEQYPAYYDQTRGGRIFLAGRSPLSPSSQPPSSQPPLPQPPSPSMESLARSFLEEYMRQSEGTQSDYLEFVQNIFDANVMYYGKRVTKQSIIEEQRKFVARWPQRSFRPKPETVQISCDTSRSTCGIFGDLNYHSTNPGTFKVSTGVWHFEFQVMFSRSGAKIIEEDGRTVSRAN